MAERRSRRRRRVGSGSGAQYPRTARVSELCHQIVADELERIDDDRLHLVTVTYVEVDPDLRHAVVEFTTLGDGADAAAALAEQRTRLQASIGRQARLKRTPELRFRPDEAARTAARVEELLRGVAEDTAGDRPPQ